ncbi:hypothetical protein BDZ45DRAFT_693080 [Acephala macrosclerotiorum]|nr:hypothetical protein BDZ45DRAFT_693080 [Acephala macrosclerotiorum]
MTIPESGVAALKHPLDSAWKHNPLEYGGGVVAQAEAFRRLPCLNMIRQHTYLDHYEIPPEGFTGSANMSRTHVDHCIESLRPRVMCAVDVTLVPFRLEEDLPLGAVPVLTKHLIFVETHFRGGSFLNFPPGMGSFGPTFSQQAWEIGNAARELELDEDDV